MGSVETGGPSDRDSISSREGFQMSRVRAGTLFFLEASPFEHRLARPHYMPTGEY